MIKFKEILSIIIFIIGAVFAGWCLTSCKADVDFVCEADNCVDCRGLKPEAYTFKDANGNELTNCTYEVCELQDNYNYKLVEKPIEGASCDLDGDAGTLHGVCKIVENIMQCIEVK